MLNLFKYVNVSIAYLLYKNIKYGIKNLPLNARIEQSILALLINRIIINIRMRDLGRAQPRTIKTSMPFQKQSPSVASKILKTQIQPPISTAPFSLSYHNMIAIDLCKSQPSIQSTYAKQQVPYYQARKTVGNSTYGLSQQNRDVKVHSVSKNSQIVSQQTKNNQIVAQQSKIVTKSQVENNQYHNNNSNNNDSNGCSKAVVCVQLQKSNAKVIPVKNICGLENQIRGKPTKQVMQYEKIDTTLKNISMMRSQILKYLLNRFRGWVFQMSDEQVQKLYNQIVKQRKFFEAKNEKIKAIQRQKNEKQMQQIKQAFDRYNSQWQSAPKTKPLKPKKSLKSSTSQKSNKSNNKQQSNIVNLISSSQMSSAVESDDFVISLDSYTPAQNPVKQQKPKQNKPSTVKPNRKNYSRARIISYVEYEDYSGSTPNNSNSNSIQMQTLLKDNKIQQIEDSNKTLKAVQQTQDSNSNGVAILNRNIDDKQIQGQPQKRVHLDPSIGLNNNNKTKANGCKNNQKMQQIDKMIKYCTNSLKIIVNEIKQVTHSTK